MACLASLRSCQRTAITLALLMPCDRHSPSDISEGLSSLRAEPKRKQPDGCNHRVIRIRMPLSISGGQLESRKGQRWWGHLVACGQENSETYLSQGAVRGITYGVGRPARRACAHPMKPKEAPVSIDTTASPLAIIANLAELEESAVAPVDGFPGYFVTNDGRVFSTRGGSPRKLSTGGPRLRYPSVCLVTADGDRRRLRVHRLVAKAFLPTPPARHNFVLHADDQPDNCAAHNLRWGDAKMNAADRDRNGKTPRGETHGNSKLTREQALKLRSLRERPNEDWTYASLAREYGVTAVTISNAMNGRTWCHLSNAADVCKTEGE